MFRLPSPLQRLDLPLLDSKQLKVLVKRDDLIHDEISGNKWRKLRYNLEHVRAADFASILTFGGAHSNHIVASAYAGKHFGIATRGVVRGEEPASYGPTLKRCKELGMDLSFVSRDDYRRRNDPEYLAELQRSNSRCFIIPEGGANALGVRGCREIVDEIEIPFDVITVDCGTAATVTGIALALAPGQRALAIPVLKGGSYLANETKRLGYCGTQIEWHCDYHFGGYAKYKPELLVFMRNFFQETGIKLDPIYTGKQFFGVFDLIRNNHFTAGSTIILTHTGGLQGIEAFEKRYRLEIYPAI